MNWPWTALLLSVCLSSEAGAAWDCHSSPSDFLRGWLDGRIAFESEGQLVLGGDESPSGWSPSSHLRSQIPGSVPSLPDQEGRWSSARAWDRNYGALFDPSGLSRILLHSTGVGWTEVSRLPSAHLGDVAWHEGVLHVLLKPREADATSCHVYRLKSAPNGIVGVPQLAALAPPGVILTQLAVVEDRLFVTGRLAGEEEHRLFELRDCSGRAPGWYDCGTVNPPAGRGWDLQNAGESLLVVSPGWRNVQVCRIPNPGEKSEWGQQRLESGPWEEAFARLTTRLERNRDSSAMVVNRFRLPDPARVQGLRLLADSGSVPPVRYRLAKSESEFYSDWSPFNRSGVIPISQEAQFVQYQISQQTESPRVRMREVRLEWSQDGTPTREGGGLGSLASALRKPAYPGETAGMTTVSGRENPFFPQEPYSPEERHPRKSGDPEPADRDGFPLDSRLRENGVVEQDNTSGTSTTPNQTSQSQDRLPPEAFRAADRSLSSPKGGPHISSSSMLGQATPGDGVEASASFGTDPRGAAEASTPGRVDSHLDNSPVDRGSSARPDGSEQHSLANQSREQGTEPPGVTQGEPGPPGSGSGIDGQATASAGEGQLLPQGNPNSRKPMTASSTPKSDFSSPGDSSEQEPAERMEGPKNTRPGLEALAAPRGSVPKEAEASTPFAESPELAGPAPSLAGEGAKLGGGSSMPSDVKGCCEGTAKPRSGISG